MSDIKLERKIVWLAGLIQLAHVLDFMIIMPLGPDLTTAIDIPSSKMGLLGGSYTFAATISGIAFARYLDRYDRKNAVLFFLIGLVISTFLCTFAWDTNSMLFARTVAGFFGGPVTALSLSMVVDKVPVERRGRAIAIVTSAFTVSSVFGIPLALELALKFNWQAPFYTVAILGILIIVGIILMLPPMSDHIDKNSKEPQTVPIWPMLKRREIQLSFLLLALLSFAQFSLFSATVNYFVFNLGFAREGLSEIYVVGGVLSFIVMMLTGRIIDLYGNRLLSIVITAFYVCILADGFLHIPIMPIMAVFSLFMMSAAIMGVICSTIASEAPGERERAAFMSLQTTFRNMAAGAGGLVASWVLISDENERLTNVPIIASIAIICIILLPIIIITLRRELNLKNLK
ncbi:MAG: MFS transporter [Kordiimonadaceae bacterium]|jgi:predicted MFS family arabinose efflux permease|nr:MFS transporter [Kordiimonadaceae bacterium]MBT6033790.1 MFS transporter [Kordiimonadaceae bacterium]